MKIKSSNIMDKFDSFENEIASATFQRYFDSYKGSFGWLGSNVEPKTLFESISSSGAPVGKVTMGKCGSEEICSYISVITQVGHVMIYKTIEEVVYYLCDSQYASWKIARERGFDSAKGRVKSMDQILHFHWIIDCYLRSEILLPNNGAFNRLKETSCLTQ